MKLFLISVIFLAIIFSNVIGDLEKLMIKGFAGTEYVGYQSWNTTLTGTLAALGQVSDVCGDTLGNIFIVESSSNRISKIAVGTLTVTPIAGLGYGPPSFTSNTLPGTLSNLNVPNALWVDPNGNIFIADTNGNRIRKYTASTGILSTVAGTGTSGFTADNVYANSSQLWSPNGVWGDTYGNLYISDTNNKRIRMVLASNSIISTIVGNGTAGTTENLLGTQSMITNPFGIRGDTNGNIYFIDKSIHRLKVLLASSNIVKTVAGNGQSGIANDNGPATNAKLNNPSGVWIDPSTGNIYIADSNNNRIRKVTPGGFISTVAGGSTLGFAGDFGRANMSALATPYSVWGDSNGLLYIADKYNRRIRVMDMNTKLITTLAGSGLVGDNFPAPNAQFYNPYQIILDTASNLYIADNNNCRVRKIFTDTNIIVSVAGTNWCQLAGDNGPATLASLNNPRYLYLDTSSNLFIADTSNYRIRKVTAIGSIISTVMGTSWGAFVENSTASTVHFKGMSGFWMDSNGNIYVGDNSFQKILKLNAHTNLVTTFAGTGTASWTGDHGPASLATINAPQQIWGDSNYNLYFADSANNRIRVISLLTNTITTFAGTGTVTYNGEHRSALLTNLNTPSSIIGDSAGNLYISDRSSNRIRMLTQVNSTFWMTTTIIGSGSGSVSTLQVYDATSSPMGSVYSFCIDANYTFYISDNNYNRIRSTFYVTIPTGQPSRQPSSQPTKQPISRPTAQPSRGPSSQPTRQPISAPTSRPSVGPTGQPSLQPFSFPTSKPSGDPSAQPTCRPSSGPSTQPSTQPQASPSSQPSRQPYSNPTSHPSTVPSGRPSTQPSQRPSNKPSIQPQSSPTSKPSRRPTTQPSRQPSQTPSSQPISRPTISPSSKPSTRPLSFPSSQPSRKPSNQPTSLPTDHPSRRPSAKPTNRPNSHPSAQPNAVPSSQPIGRPSAQPTSYPSSQPSVFPSRCPSAQPLSSPTSKPSRIPTEQPYGNPSSIPSGHPSLQPISCPSSRPSSCPSVVPSMIPTSQPFSHPTTLPSDRPSCVPSTIPSTHPSCVPLSIPSRLPTVLPTSQPICSPSVFPSSHPTRVPSDSPSNCPTELPSSIPTSYQKSPSTSPSSAPLSNPTDLPTMRPSNCPSAAPSKFPKSVPTSNPSSQPSSHPSRTPQSLPSSSPSNAPVSYPTSRPVVITVHPSFTHFNNGTLPSSFPLSVDLDVPFKIVLFLFEGVTYQNLPFSNITLVNQPPVYGSNFVVFGKRNFTQSDIDVRNEDMHSQQYEKMGGGLAIEGITRSVSMLKDVNGDGYDDLIIGSPLTNNAYVLFGNYKGLKELRLGFTIYGESGGDYLGWSVSDVGDFNGDGFNDYITCALAKSVCYLLWGKAKGYCDVYLSQFNKAIGIKIIGSNHTTNLGIAVSSAGDFNADGLTDIVVSARGQVGANIMYVIYGSRFVVDNIYLNNLPFSYSGFRILSPTLSFAGLSLSGLGDINGDGCDDVAVGGTPYQAGYSYQVTWIIYGKAGRRIQDLTLSELSTQDGYKIIGGGIVVSGVGDMDHDGLNDIMITNYINWQGQVGSFIIQLPLPQNMLLTRNPSLFPTSHPSKFQGRPSNFPSSQPTYAFDAPSSLPSSFPSCPTLIPTLFPSSPTSVPSSYPSNLVSIRPSKNRTQSISTAAPTVAPSSLVIIKTRRPTISPTVHPSTTMPTFLPTISPTDIPTLSPTELPTLFPTVIPSISPTFNLNPTSMPSFSPTVSLNQPFVTEEIDNNKDFNASTISHALNQRFVINSVEDVTLSGGKGRNIYEILPQQNMTITILNFQRRGDIIDLAHFSSTVQNINQLSYETFPLRILLPNDQHVLLSGYLEFTLSENNFIFSTVAGGSAGGTGHSTTPKYTYASKTSILSFNVILALALFGGFIFGTTCVVQIKDFCDNVIRHVKATVEDDEDSDDDSEKEEEEETRKRFLSQFKTERNRLANEAATQNKRRRMKSVREDEGWKQNFHHHLILQKSLLSKKDHQGEDDSSSSHPSSAASSSSASSVVHETDNKQVLTVGKDRKLSIPPERRMNKILHNQVAQIQEKRKIPTVPPPQAAPSLGKLNKSHSLKMKIANMNKRKLSAAGEAIRPSEILKKVSLQRHDERDEENEGEIDIEANIIRNKKMEENVKFIEDLELDDDSDDDSDDDDDDSSDLYDVDFSLNSSLSSFRSFGMVSSRSTASHKSKSASNSTNTNNKNKASNDSSSGEDYGMSSSDEDEDAESDDSDSDGEV